MLLEAMVGQDRDHNPKVADLASIKEVPGDMAGEYFAVPYSQWSLTQP